MAMFFQTKKRKEIVVTKLLRLSELCPVLSFPVSLRDFFFFFFGCYPVCISQQPQLLDSINTADGNVNIKCSRTLVCLFLAFWSWGGGGAAGGSRNGGGEKGFHLFSSLVSSYRDSHFYHATTFI